MARMSGRTSTEIVLVEKPELTTENLCVDGKIILKLSSSNKVRDLRLNSFVQDMDKRQAVMKMAMNLRFYKLLEISPVAEELLAFKDEPLLHGVSHSVKKTNKPCNI